jgi:L-cystine uptake protein TcyP (sodium:dicarboxylate symporter family)
VEREYVEVVPQQPVTMVLAGPHAMSTLELVRKEELLMFVLLVYIKLIWVYVLHLTIVPLEMVNLPLVQYLLPKDVYTTK